MTVVYLIRHGETDWNIEGRWQGQADVSLNENGLKQAVLIAGKLREVNLQAIFSSDLIRAIQTAQEIARLQGLRIIIDKRLREIHQGDWQGMLVSDIKEKYAEKFRQRMTDPYSVAPPGGETAREVKDRVMNALNDIIKDYPAGNVAIISHGFALAVMLTCIKDLPISAAWDLIPDNTEIIKIEVNRSFC